MICTKCKEDKDEESFSFRSNSKTIRRTQCRSCHSAYRKQKYLDNKEKEKSQVLNYREKNPDKYTPEYRKAAQKKHSSFSLKAGRTLESKCAVCDTIVFITNKEKEENYKRYCSLVCRQTTFKDSFYHYYKDVIKRDKKGKINNISVDYIKQLLINQNYKCNITGLPIKLYKKNEIKNLYNSASLDRIDSNLGYIEGNVQWVAMGVNYMKMNYSNEELIETIRLIRAVV